MKNIKEILKKSADLEPEKYYPVEKLKENGFIRNKCKSCGCYFWSLENSDVCGEPECSGGYTFIRNPVGKKMSYIDGWIKFKEHMEKRGYTPIKRYPVAARWRDDTDFVQASIYDFQPWVVTGEIEPPANPLIIPQICLRFNSIENVGITGRHKTGFVMIGQHAFQPSEKYDQEKYFEDILSWIKVCGIPFKELKIHEKQWAGGGNAGPCMEFFVRGNELLNQVYMFYKVYEERLEPLKLKVLDMGMGQDRIPWLTQGCPTIYEVSWPKVRQELFKRTGLKESENYERFIPHGSILDVDSEIDLENAWNKIALKLGIEKNVLQKEIFPIAHLYSVGDHVQALLIAISDGVLPSNSGGGYNLRVLLRRALTFIKKYGWDLKLEEIAEWHAKEMKKQYPELLENLEEVKEVLEFEEKKYFESMKTMKRIIEKFSNKEITKEDMVLLYTSYGITPELLKESNPKIEIPKDFYSKISEKEKVEKSKEKEFEIDITGLPETKKLYYSDLKECDATVVKSFLMDGKHFIILDQTIFYPESGGQDSDFGFINGKRMLYAKKIGRIISHEVEGEFKEGEKVHCILDFERRKQLSIHHTATHILNASARMVLGNHIWQAGAEKKVNKSHLDITHYENLTPEQIEKIERKANEIIEKDIPILIHEFPRNIAEQKYGFRIYQGGAIPEKILRIIEIPGIDAEACGGTHLKRTSEVEKIKIIKSTKIQDGQIRLEFVAGNKLIEKTLEELNKRIEMEKHIAEEKKAAWEKQKEIIKRAREESEKYEPNKILFLSGKTMNEIQEIGRKLVSRDKTAYSILVSENIVFGILGEDFSGNQQEIENKIIDIARKMGGSVGRKNREWKGGGPKKISESDL
ncbi:MAG: alanine--tRNA ligase [Candidatus Aenigmatarchaeota archaeon]|nr:alanine--tRNA ligase [Candidatus Aenigmarchaeota archaeon]